MDVATREGIDLALIVVAARDQHLVARLIDGECVEGRAQQLCTPAGGPAAGAPGDVRDLALQVMLSDTGETVQWPVRELLAAMSQGEAVMDVWGSRERWVSAFFE